MKAKTTDTDTHIHSQTPREAHTERVTQRERQKGLREGDDGGGESGVREKVSSQMQETWQVDRSSRARQ